MAFIEGLFTLLGRILLAGIFLATAVEMIQNPQRAQTYMTEEGKLDQLYPAEQRTVPTLMWAAVGCLVVGGISVLFGYKARFGAFLLLLFIGATCYFFHHFWTYSDGETRNKVLSEFLKNCAISGGLFIILARGAGRFSIDGPAKMYDEF